MIISLNTTNPAFPRIVEMNADEDGILLRILDRDAFIQRNEYVGRSNHDGFQLRFAQLALEALRDIERNYFLWRSGATIRAAVFAAMASIHYNGRKSFARVFDSAGLHARARAK